MDDPGYSELPGWGWLPPVLLGVVAVGVLFALGLVARRGTGRSRVLLPVLGGLALAGIGWWALSPVTVQVGGQLVQCGSAGRDAFLRGNPTDATLNPADRACRSQARRTLAEQAAALILLGGGATVAMRAKPFVRQA